MPPFSVNPADWFLTDRQNPHSSLSLFTSGNLVEALIDGKSYMESIHNRILGCFGTNDYLFFAGWRLDLDQQLKKNDPDSLVPKVFTDAKGRGVDVRVLLSGHLIENTAAYKYFRGTEGHGIQCVLDNRLPSYGSHHQKLACISESGKLHAFCGGIDLAALRWDDRTHSHGGWHDIQTYIKGPACYDLDTTFRERWDDHTRPNKLWPVPSDMTLPAPPPAPLELTIEEAATHTHHVQILRTYACGVGYPFAPQGETSVRRACRQAIPLAQDLIYIEDQYFVSYEIAKLIEEALRARPLLRVIVVLPRLQTAKPPRSFHFHQSVLLEKLRSVAPNQFECYDLDRSGDEIYVHSKTIIVDDVWVKIGSSNLCRRDFSYDSQVDVAIVDGNIENGVCKFARDLRRELWAEHLALPPSDTSFVHPIDGFQRWKDRAGRPGVPAKKHFPPQKDFYVFWDIADPQGLCAGEPRMAP